MVTETFFGKISFISFILLRDNSDKNTVAFIYGLDFSTPFPPTPVFPNGSIPPMGTLTRLDKVKANSGQERGGNRTNDRTDFDRWKVY